ncbi:hypothetical protein FOA52_001635 [Chlamydomonas sp. UWO 241]|jgi:hypothetical protein|nr:hypothetical protein FOA52_001635 [Chlamydomonas sp. UWO 241]
MDAVLSLVSRCRDLTAGECSCADEECELVFRDAFLADVSMADTPEDALPTSALKRAHTAGVLAACMHIWACVVVAGRRAAHRGTNTGALDLFCCLKGTASTTATATATCREARCFMLYMKPYFAAVDEIVSVVTRCINVIHPSFDVMLSNYTDIGQLSRAAMGQKSVYEGVLERLRGDTVALTRRAMTAVDAATADDVSAAEWPPIPHDVSSIVPFSVDLRDEAAIIMRAHDILFPPPSSPSQYSKGDISMIARSMCATYTRSTTFYIVPVTNAAVRHIIELV